MPIHVVTSDVILHSYNSKRQHVEDVHHHLFVVVRVYYLTAVCNCYVWNYTPVEMHGLTYE